MSGSPPAREHRRGIGMTILAMAAIALAIGSVFVGSRTIAPHAIVDALVSPHGGDDALVVWHSRLPRTVIALCAGGCLGMAGALMQSLTRNALAEPGTLGINSGAAAGVVCALLVGNATIETYVWFSFAGSALAAVLVHRLGRAHEAGHNPVRLVLAGAGVSVTLGSFTTLGILAGPQSVFSGMRSWATGSLEGRGWDVVPILLASLIAGALACLCLAGSLNSTILGAEMGRSLGVNIPLTWGLTNVTIIVLAGAATAAIGPVGFVGLAAPHMARYLGGTDHRWLLPLSGLFAMVVLLLADIGGRLVVAPNEIGAGIMSALIGAPFFIALVRRGKVSGL